MDFEEIVQGVETPIVLFAPFEYPEEFILCEDCGRYVRARPTAWQLHQDLTCQLYREAVGAA